MWSVKWSESRVIDVYPKGQDWPILRAFIPLSFWDNVEKGVPIEIRNDFVKYKTSTFHRSWFSFPAPENQQVILERNLFAKR